MLKRAIVEALLAGTAFVLGRWVLSDELRPELYGMSIGFMFAILAELTISIWENRHFLRLYLQCLWSTKELRLTVAYLFRIEVNGRYLLVKSKRLLDTYQPVGGVYKYFNPEGRQQLERLGMVSDDFIPNDDISEYDLRIRLYNRRQVRPFLNWFFCNENREADPWREFYEELVVPGLLSREKFGYIHYELVGQEFEPIHHDRHFRIDTFKYADIYRPKFVTRAQEDAVRQLMQIPHADYIWASRDEILQCRSCNGKRIADHTKKIFTTKKFQ